MDWRDLIPDFVCPACKSPLILVGAGTDERLKCQSCRRHYPVRDNIPILLVDQAEVRD